jgi:hypothetical protein
MPSACGVLPCHLRPVRLYHIFPHYKHKQHDFRIKFTEHKMCFDFSLQFFLEHFSFYDKFSEILSQMYIDLHIKYPLSLPDVNETWFFPKEFRRVANIKFQQNPFSGSRVVPYGRTDRRTGMTKLIVAIRNFANAPTNDYFFVRTQQPVFM